MKCLRRFSIFTALLFSFMQLFIRAIVEKHRGTVVLRKMNALVFNVKLVLKKKI